jgi:hypothetical protein
VAAGLGTPQIVVSRTLGTPEELAMVSERQPVERHRQPHANVHRV